MLTDNKSDWILIAAICENPDCFSKTARGYTLNEPARYPAFHAALTEFQNKHQNFSIRPVTPIQEQVLKKDEDEKLFAFLYDGVIRALYSSGQYDAAQSQDPVIVTNLLQSTGLKTEQLFNGRPFQRLFGDLDMVEKVIVLQSDTLKHRHKAEMKKHFAKAALFAEAGRKLDKELEDYLRRHNQEYDFYRKNNEQRTKEYGELFKKLFPKAEVPTPSPASVADSASPLELLADTLQKQMGLKFPEPKLLIGQLEQQLKMER